jgi:peroxiredoxin
MKSKKEPSLLERIAWSAAAVFLVLAAVSGCSTGEADTAEAPDFTLEDLRGNSVTLSDYRGKVVLLDFWATWCPPCRRSIPEMVDLQERYGEEGLVILGVSLDDPARASDEFLREFKDANRMNYTVLRGNQAVVADYFGDERFSIPTLFVVNRQGRIVDKHVGFRPGAVEESLKEVL